jgi:steroid 5-alpha reductase family enzyme
MIRKLIRIPIVLGLAAGFGYLLGHESRLLFGIPLMWCLAIQSFAIQILAFIPALIFNTEMFFDLTGAITFISMAIVTIVTNNIPSLHQYVAAGMIVVWSGRLGSFLFMRILKVGEDSRFEPIKKDKIRFFVVWLLQGLWCIIPTSPLLVILTA